MTILVVDDDPLLRFIVKAALHGEGFETIEASDGIEAYKIIQAMGSSIDLLLADLNMPRLDGLLLAILAAEPSLDMSILLMTGQPSLLPDGPIGSYVLKKPFPLPDLVQTVRTVAPSSGRNSHSSQSELVEAYTFVARESANLIQGPDRNKTGLHAHHCRNRVTNRNH